MDDLLSEFLTETNEGVAQLDVQLVELEQNPSKELLSSIFRLVHTIKGTCGFLGLPRLEKVAHAGENVLGKFRDGELPVTPEAVSLIFRSMDTIKGILSALEQTEKEPEGDDTQLIADLNAMADGKAAAAPATPAEPAAGHAPVVEESAEPMAAAPAEVTEQQEAAVPAVAETPAEVPPETVKAAAPPAAAAEGAAKESSLAQSIRVNVDVLEDLMTMVSELVLTRNQLLQISRMQKDSEFTPPLQRLNHVVSELQEGVMKTRMQPIGNAWSKLPRIVRDLSIELKKKIDLQMLGADTELDRQVLEMIKDPLTHMVRNSGDHGIEGPADRIKAGKPETGRITLNAYHEGGHIIIEISDDGKGLPIDMIKKKAVKNGLATESELEALSDQQIMQFIFKPGFSTAAQVTSVSGRGVGMDVVRTNIEKIGGTIDMNSVYGKGSRFLIKIPLTLAIVSALIVECAGERFAVPQLSVIELVRTSARSEYRIEHINNASVLRLRNRLLPLISLRELLKLEDNNAERKEDECFIVVAQVGASTFGIMVDRVFDTEEIVVKPVSPILRHINIFSGNTILGDGSVIMILDPNGIASNVGEIQGAALDGADAQASQKSKQGSRQALLLFRAGSKAPKAVPLALVARLEDVDMETVELSNGKPVVQYRGKLMPLVPIQEGYEIKRTGNQPVLVFADNERSMGLIVDEIVDIVEDNMNVELSTDKTGLMGSAIISGKATDVIDIGYYLDLAFPDWFGVKDEDTFGEEKTNNILLVDDSPFFRNLLTPLLTVAGYKVTTAENPLQAIKLMEGEQLYDAVVSDIEMPGMNGFDFVTKLRQDEKWRATPVIAMSSHTTPRDLERGRQVGFTDYVAKFDREGLLQALHHSLKVGGTA
ncbi:MAG: response regulator [Alphaproteobacteria bacterium]|nr:response regulator [Alphaproteobacteria bacterium]